MSHYCVEKLSRSLIVNPSTSQEIASLTSVLSSWIVWLAVLMVFEYAGSTFAQADSPDTKRPAANPQQLPELFSREKEIALALSAAPEHLRTGAGVYVLERSGFVKVRDSANAHVSDSVEQRVSVVLLRKGLGPRNSNIGTIPPLRAAGACADKHIRLRRTA
jgi:hypothetical protein